MWESLWLELVKARSRPLIFCAAFPTFSSPSWTSCSTGAHRAAMPSKLCLCLLASMLRRDVSRSSSLRINLRVLVGEMLTGESAADDDEVEPRWLAFLDLRASNSSISDRMVRKSPLEAGVREMRSGPVWNSPSINLEGLGEVVFEGDARAGGESMVGMVV